MADFDLAVIGGGINGTGIARDAAGRGLRVVLIEQNDLASGTSSASSKLIHGGLRYLEHGEFRLVHEALREREVLLRAAPHLIRPIRFVLPINEDATLSDAAAARASAFTIGSVGAKSCRAPARSISLPTRRGCRSKRDFITPSNIPTALPTTRGLSCSMPSMLPNAAP